MFENMELCHALIQHSSDVISIIGIDGTMLFQSPSIERLFGYSPEELIGKNAFDMVHQEDLQIVRDAFMQVVQSPHGHLSVEYRFKHKDGSWHEVESTGSNQLSNMLIKAIVVNSRDITERNAAQREKEHLIMQLKASLKNIRTLTGLLPMCAWCRKIRDDSGYWKKVEVYISEHTDATFTHGICPDCLKTADPETYKFKFGDSLERRDSTENNS